MPKIKNTQRNKAVQDSVDTPCLFENSIYFYYLLDPTLNSQRL